MYNAHRLFYQPSPQPCLRTELVLTVAQDAKLVESRDKVRAALKEGLRRAGDFLPRQEYYSGEFLREAKSYEAPDLVLKPKFRSQGSWRYNTLNRPAKPRQQIDLDEGMYIAMSMVKGAPAIASSALYRIVETILARLCEVEGWTMDTSKSICIRLYVDEEAHIDLNIYALPDAQLALVEKRAMVQFGKGFDSELAMDAQTARQIRLDPDQVYVAHRRKGWEKSDPLELEDWFLDAVDRHSPWTDLRRIVRYLKAWRD